MKLVDAAFSLNKVLQSMASFSLLNKRSAISAAVGCGHPFNTCTLQVWNFSISLLKNNRSITNTCVNPNEKYCLPAIFGSWKIFSKSLYSNVWQFFSAVSQVAKTRNLEETGQQDYFFLSVTLRATILVEL